MKDSQGVKLSGKASQGGGIFSGPERLSRSEWVERECSRQEHQSENGFGGGCGHGAGPGDGKDMLLQTSHSQRGVLSAAVGQ